MIELQRCPALHGALRVPAIIKTAPTILNVVLLNSESQYIMFRFPLLAMAFSKVLQRMKPLWGLSSHFWCLQLQYWVRLSEAAFMATSLTTFPYVIN